MTTLKKTSLGASKITCKKLTQLWKNSSKDRELAELAAEIDSKKAYQKFKMDYMARRKK
jgi:hypothetical protein